MKLITKFSSIELFETERLIARKVIESDFNVVCSFYQDPVVMATLGGVVAESIVKERFQGCLNAWAERGYDAWLWYEKDSNKLMGRGGLHHREIDEEDAVAIGYVLLPDFWNKGYATEIASACVEIAFEVIKLEKLFCSIEVSNKPSLRVIEKAGFKFMHNISFVGESHRLYSREAS